MAENQKKSVLSPRDKRLKKKDHFLKAKKSYEEYLSKRKREVADLLFSINEEIGDFSNEQLKPYLTKMCDQVASDNE